METCMTNQWSEILKFQIFFEFCRNTYDSPRGLLIVLASFSLFYHFSLLFFSFPYFTFPFLFFSCSICFMLLLMLLKNQILMFYVIHLTVCWTYGWFSFFYVFLKWTWEIAVETNEIKFRDIVPFSLNDGHDGARSSCRTVIRNLTCTSTICRINWLYTIKTARSIPDPIHRRTVTALLRWIVASSPTKFVLLLRYQYSKWMPLLSLGYLDIHR